MQQREKWTPVLSFRNSVAVVTTQVARIVSRCSSVKVKVWSLPSLSPWPRTIAPPALVLSSHQCFSSVGRGQPALSHSHIITVAHLHCWNCTGWLAHMIGPKSAASFHPCAKVLQYLMKKSKKKTPHKYCSYSTLSAGFSVFHQHVCLQSFTFNQKKASPCATGGTCSD